MPVINEKRLRLPGLEITGKCPNCQSTIISVLDENYLSYPDYNENTFQKESIYCIPCEDDFEVEFKLNIQIEMRKE